MAGKGGGEALGDIGSFLGNAFIPQTMEHFRQMAQAPKQASAVSNLIDSSGMTATDASQAPGSVSRPGISDQIFRNIAPNVDGAKFNAIESIRGASPAFDAAFLTNKITQMFPRATTKDDFVGTPGEGGVYDIRKGAMVPGTQIAKPVQPPSDVQSALWQANGDPDKARAILAQKGQGDGDWAIRASDAAPVFLTKQQLLGSPQGTYLPRPTGMKITSDGQGGFEMTTGGMGGEDMTNSTKTALETTITQGTDGLARLRGIVAKAKPEYQQLGTRWSNFVASAKEKAGVQIDDTTKQNLSDFTQYRRDVVANTNQTIKDLTGATVGKDEAPRLLQQMPVAGQGMFDGDSPTEFQAKLKGTLDSISASVARAQYARANGLSKKAQFAIPLTSIPKIVQDKGDQYRDEMKRANPQVPDTQIAEAVKEKLRKEFGL